MKIDVNRLSVSTFAYWHYTFDYCLDSIAAAGFKNVEFWAASPQFSYLDYTPEERVARKAEINKMLKDRGLEMKVFFPEQQDMYPLNIASPNEYLRNNSIGYMKGYIDDAKDFGVKTMVLAPGWHVEDDQDPANYTRSIEAMQELCAYGANYGIDMAVGEWGKVSRAWAYDMDLLGKMLKDVGAPNIKAILNTGAAHGNGECICKYIDTFGDKLGLIQIADSGSKALGRGDTAEADMKMIEESGYTGNITLDIRFRDVCVNPDEPVFESALWLKKRGYLG